MAISYIGSATGTDTATPPTHQAGDLIIVFAYRDGSTTNPTLGSGATQIGAPDGTSCSATIGYFIATGAGTSIGTWTNATSTICHVYRSSTGSVFPGAGTGNAGTTTTVNYPALTLNNTSGTSWVAAFAGISSTDTSLQTAPTGMVNRSTVQDATGEAAGHDTDGGVTSWSSTNVSVGGTAGNWITVLYEIAESPITYVGANTANATTVTVPAHVAGDLILIFAFRDGNTSAPTLPSGYTSKATPNSNTFDGAALRIGYKIAADDTDTSGTWTSATQLVCQVYRGVDQTTPLGGSGSSSRTSQGNTTASYPTLTMTATDGTSWVTGFGGSCSANTAVDTAPAGMVQRATATAASSEVAGFDTYGGRSAWTAKTVALGGTDNDWIAATVEVVASTSVDVTVSPTGLSATGATNSVTFVGKVTIAPTGLSATGSTNSVTVTGVANVSVTGESATGSTNSVTVAIPKTVAVTGETATGSTNSVTVTGAAVVTPTGLSATGSVNSVTVTGTANVSVTGETATGSPNDVTVTGDALVTPTGLSATGSVNSVTVTNAVTVTGETATGSTNSVTVTGAANVSVAGETATGSTNSVTVRLVTTVSVTGETATGSTNSVTVTGDAVVTPTGLSATGSVNSVVVLAGIIVPVTGETATGSTNDVTVTSSTLVTPTGVSATGSTNSVTVRLVTTVPVTGETATGSVNSVTVFLPTIVAVTGVSASGSVGNVFINPGWAIIDTTQTANWQQISTAQTSNWTDVQT